MQVLALKTFEETELEMHHGADDESEQLLQSRRRPPQRSMLRFGKSGFLEEGMGGGGMPPPGTPRPPPGPPPPGSMRFSTMLPMLHVPGGATALLNTGVMVKDRAKAYGHHEALEGCTPVMFSISASEGPNILLRNFLGKVACALWPRAPSRLPRTVPVLLTTPVRRALVHSPSHGGACG